MHSKLNVNRLKINDHVHITIQVHYLFKKAIKVKYKLLKYTFFGKLVFKESFTAKQKGDNQF